MRTVSFDTKELPELGAYCLMIRDSVIYRKSGVNLVSGKNMYEMARVFATEHLYPYEFKDGDRLFEFPSEVTLVRAMENRECLDKYAVKLKGKSALEQVLRMLNEGRILSLSTKSGNKYRLVNKNDRTYTQTFDQVGKKDVYSGTTENMFTSTDNTIHEFATEKEFWQWALTK